MDIHEVFNSTTSEAIKKALETRNVRKTMIKWIVNMLKAFYNLPKNNRANCKFSIYFLILPAVYN